ncbi:MAG: helix-turn-helix domain-containing protein, partial [Chloroflexota bacterium]
MARHKEFDQDVIVNKAMDLFRLKGYEATSIQDLVDHLGIGRGSIYDTFGNKHQLYLLALDRYLNKDNPDFDPTNLPVPAKELIIQMMHQQVDDALEAVPGGGCMMVNSAMELGLQDKAVGDRIKKHITKSET